MNKDKTEREERIHRIANNALYFRDNSDYQTALWEILNEFDDQAELPRDLEYMES